MAQFVSNDFTHVLDSGGGFYSESIPLKENPSFFERIRKIFESLGILSPKEIAGEDPYIQLIERMKLMEPEELLGLLSSRTIRDLAEENVLRQGLTNRKAPRLKLGPDQLNSGPEILRELFQNSPGICLGESHNDFAPKEFLQDHMEELKRLGVGMFFVEGAYLQDELLIEDFNEGRTDDLSWAFPNDRKTLLEARKFGIKIYPIDCERTGNTNTRLLNLNYSVLLKVEAARKKNPSFGKYVVWVGARHTNTIKSGNRVIPGISELLNIPSIIIQNDRFLQARPKEVHTMIDMPHPFIDDTKVNLLVYYKCCPKHPEFQDLR